MEIVDAKARLWKAFPRREFGEGEKEMTLRDAGMYNSEKWRSDTHADTMTRFLTQCVTKPPTRACDGMYFCRTLGQLEMLMVPLGGANRARLLESGDG